jgi:methyl acetate hydrolase
MRMLMTSFACLLGLMANLDRSRPASTMTISPERRAELSEFLQGAVNRREIPGVVALVTSGGRELYLEAFGQARVADRVPMARNSIFRIASMTKPVTTVAAMMLVEQGKLALDAPVSTYLPDYHQPMVVASFDGVTGRIATRPAARPITIRHLLTQTSGIGYAFDDPILAALQNAGKKDDEFPLLHDPGEKWTYGSSTQLLGRVVEKVSGEPLDVVFRNRIFEPLGMADTFYRVPEEKHARLVTRHQRKDGALTELPNASAEAPPIRGDGGLSSDASDYAAFLRMLLNRGSAGATRLLQERTVESMTTNQIGDLAVRQMPSTMPTVALSFPVGAGRDKFGFGFQIAEKGTSARSRGSYSWAGVYNTFFWVDPERQIGVVVLMQVLPFFDERCKAVVAGFEDRLYRESRGRS